GVFGVIPNMEGLLTDKIGLDFDNVKTNDNAGFVSVNRPLTEYEREVLQKGVEKTYEVFTSKVAEGRNMTMEEVNEIGQGRVWSGVDAKKIGLIDEFGGLKYAMNRAAEMADIPEDDYRVLRIPEKKAPLEELIDEIIGRNSSVRMKSELGPLYDYYDYIKEVTKMQGTQARLPYQITIK
ncbi:MAG: S49 family peptidase, partial [Bacteroidota bacterium]